MIPSKTQRELEGVTRIYSNSASFVAAIALDQKLGISYPPGCFVWSPDADSNGIPALLVYSDPTTGSQNCRPGATCICAGKPCQSTFRSKESLSVEGPGLYDAVVEYEKDKQCVYQLEQITCDEGKNYEAVVVDGKQVCQKRRKDICSKTTFGLSGSSDIHKIIVGTRLNVTSTDPQASDYNLSLVANTSPTPLRRSTTLEFPQTGAWDVYVKRGLETCVALADLEVTDRPCDELEVRTDSGACKTPMIVASVRSDSKFVEIHKPNDVLEGVPKSVPVPLEVKPSADYRVRMEYELQSGGTPSWISFSGLHSTDGSKFEERGELTYNASGILDGSELNATLVFNGTAVQNGHNTDKTTIALTGLVKSTPSFKYSTLIMTPEITKGNPFQLTIQARDSDDQQIAADRGRFLKISVQSPKQKLRTYSSVFQSGAFLVEVPRADLCEIGKYKVWVSRVFGYKVRLLQEALNLPTEAHPIKFSVIESDTTALGLGVTLGCAGALCVCILLYFMYRNPAHAKK